MSWIKAEHSLLHDARMIITAARLGSVECNGQPLQAETVALGGVLKLRLLAYGNVDENDILALGPDQVNQFVGIPNFCEIAQPQWLEIVDANRVKVLDFHRDNGTVARERDQTAMRVQRHRLRRNGQALQPGNAVALENEKEELEKKIKKTPSPFDASTVQGLDRLAWNDWVGYREKRKPAIKPESRAAAARAMAKLGAGQRAAVDHSIANGYQGLIEPPAPKVNGKHGPAARSDEAGWAEAKAAASEIGLRGPWPDESLGNFQSRIRSAKNAPPSPTVRERIANVTAQLKAVG